MTSGFSKPLLSSAVTPSQPLPYLPDEVIREILLRLPARSLLRLRSVCSSWRTLISSSQFANDHVQRLIAADPSLSEPRAFYHYGWGYESRRFGNFSVRTLLENPSPPTEVVCLTRRGNHAIIGSCNGLMCLLEINTTNSRAMLWNPCTTLMTSQSLEIGGPWLSVWGFGYDHVNNKYKLAGVVHPESSTRIYTFGTKACCRTIQHIPVNYIVGDREGVFVPGTVTLNWIRRDATLKRLVLSLDLVKETFSEFSLPNPDVDDSSSTELCVLKNCLAVCSSHKKTCWFVWLMKEHGEPQSWTKLVMILFHPLISSQLRPLYIWRNDVLVATASNSKLVLFNLYDDNFEFPVIDCYIDYYRRFRIYHESLVSPP